MIIIDLPDLSTFESKDKMVSPYDKFYIWLCKPLLKHYRSKLGRLLYDCGKCGIPKGKGLKVSSIYMNEKDEVVLHSQTIDWAIKIKKLKKEMAQKEVGWLRLDIGPRTNTTVKIGTVEVDEDYLTDHKEDSNG